MVHETPWHCPRAPTGYVVQFLPIQFVRSSYSPATLPISMSIHLIYLAPLSGRSHATVFPCTHSIRCIHMHVCLQAWLHSSGYQSASCWLSSSAIPASDCCELAKCAAVPPRTGKNALDVFACSQISRGCFWDVELAAGSKQQAGFIVHCGDNKSAGGQMLELDTEHDKELWLVESFEEAFKSEEDATSRLAGSLSSCAAHWFDSTPRAHGLTHGQH